MIVTLRLITSSNNRDKNIIEYSKAVTVLVAFGRPKAGPRGLVGLQRQIQGLGRHVVVRLGQGGVQVVAVGLRGLWRGEDDGKLLKGDGRSSFKGSSLVRWLKRALLMASD